MNKAGHVVVVVSIAASFAVLAGCKKNVDPSAFDAGATAQPVVAAATPSAPEPAAADAGVAPLAPLASAAAVPAAHKAAPKPAAKPDPPECSNARTYCSSPKAATDDKIKHLCESFKAECTAKGGKI